MSTVTIGTDTFTVLGTLTLANSHMNGSFDYASAWAAADESTRERAMVAAYRYFQTLPWRDGVDWESEDVVEEASYEYAGFRVKTPGGMGGPGGGAPGQGTVREVQDTTRRVAFNTSPGAEQARQSVVDALPRDIKAMLLPFLQAGKPRGASAPFVSGADGESVITDDKKFTLTE